MAIKHTGERFASADAEDRSSHCFSDKQRTSEGSAKGNADNDRTRGAFSLGNASMRIGAVSACYTRSQCFFVPSWHRVTLQVVIHMDLTDSMLENVSESSHLLSDISKHSSVQCTLKYLFRVYLLRM